jgi:hypothetical protein
MHAAQILPGLPELARLSCVALPGLSVSLEGFFQDSVIEKKIGNQLLQSGVLSFKLLEPAILGSTHSAIFSSSPIVGLHTDAKELAGLTYCLWRREYGGLNKTQAYKLKESEKENNRLKSLVVDRSLDNVILKEVGA